MTALILMALMWQQPCSGGGPPKNDSDCIPAEVWVHKQYSVLPQQGAAPAKPAPLKCGKWEHIQYTPASGYVIYTCPIGLCRIEDTDPARCVPDMHTVTEKEYQELLEKLDLMRRQIEYLNGPKGHWVPEKDCKGNDVPGSNGCFRYDEMPTAAKAPQSRTETR